MSRPQPYVALTVLLFLVAWTLVPSLLNSSLPLDVIESGSWGREHVLVSYKHPNLPGLLIEAMRLLTGQYGWPQYLLSALAGAATIWLVFLLGRSLFGATGGAAGALLLAGCYYFTWPIPEFNHNIAQLPLWAALCLLLWNAVEANRWWAWLLVGIVAALCLYAKLSGAALIVAGGLWILVDGPARARLWGPWPWLGLVLFVALAAPLAWLMSHGGDGLVSFIASSGANGSGALRFVGAQLAALVPLAIVLCIAIWLPRRREAGVELVGDKVRRVRVFLAIMIAVPLLSGIVAGATTGAQSMWGTPMLNLVGLAAVALWPSRFDAIALRRVARAAVVLVLIASGTYAARDIVTRNTAASPSRTQWPQTEIVDRFRAIWEHETDAPLRIVGGEDWLAGLVALGSEPRGSVYVKLDPTLSPWISQGRTEAEGMLVLWRGSETPDYAINLVAGHPHGVERFSWSDSPGAEPIEIGYVVVPPAKLR